MTHVIETRNVNTALDELRRLLNNTGTWRSRSARGSYTLEFYEPVITEYAKPQEKVSFSAARDCNPFFHLMESLWILAGRRDVAFLQIFNKKMSDYSDDGIIFHAPYGYRIRKHFAEFDETGVGEQAYDRLDQLSDVIELLSVEPDTRRAVIGIWDPLADLNRISKDLPCNDTLFFKLRDNELDLTVCCRSNDALWGAYGTNVVQFGTILEFVAGALGVGVGIYRQISDSFHVYPSTDTYQSFMSGFDWNCDPYLRAELEEGGMTNFPLLEPGANWKWFLQQCESFCEEVLAGSVNPTGYMPFFHRVAIPMWKAWTLYRTTGARTAISYLDSEISETPEEKMNPIDWLEAGSRWLARRGKQ